MAGAVWRSKLGASYPKAEVEKRHAASMSELKRLRKVPTNATCADCGAAENSWASVSLGCFLCVRCAAVHRGLGTHITKCKNTLGSYLWGADELAVMTEWGNARVNAAYLARGGPGLTAASGDAEVRAALQAKYGEKRWYAEPRGSATAEPRVERAAPAARGEVADLLTPEPRPGREVVADLLTPN